MSFAAETQLGPYRIVSLIGSGGMGEVYRAGDTRLLRDVALKVLPASFTNDPDRLRRFEQEARAVAEPSQHRFGSRRRQCERSSLHCLRIAGRRNLAPANHGFWNAGPKAIDLATQLANGLAAAHEQDIVHRDLKPENVFITRSGRLKILDFGLAKLRRLPGTTENLDGMTVTETEAGQVMGTVGYMSPEQVKGKIRRYTCDQRLRRACLRQQTSTQRWSSPYRHQESPDQILPAVTS